MAIERRVKPSARAQEALAQKRKPILIGLLVLAIIAVVGFAASIIVPRFMSVRGNNEPDVTQGDPATPSSTSGSGLTSSPDSEKALLASSAGYNGIWTDDATNGFTLYLPGTDPMDTSELASTCLTMNEARTAAFGVIVSDQMFPSLDNDPTQDTAAMLSLFLPDLIKDTGAAMYGASFSAGLDMSVSTLSDGSNIIWVAGDMETVLNVRAENAEVGTDTLMDFPLVGFIAMRNDTPIFVWGIANPDDGYEAGNLSGYMSDCSRVFASAKDYSSYSYDFAPVSDDDVPAATE